MLQSIFISASSKFELAGVPSLSLTALDPDGRITFLHRLDDTIEKVDMKMRLCAIDFAGDAIWRLTSALRKTARG